MATKIQNAVLEAMIEGAITEIMVKTSAQNVVIDTTTNKTLSTAISELIASIATKATPADIDSRINALVNGAPAAFDTLKEIADYLTAHEDKYTALVAMVGNKVEKVTGKGLSTEDFTTALKTKLESIQGYTHPTSGVTAGTYRSVTVNAQGHVTAGSNPTIPVNQGGTGATTAAAARANLGLGRVLAGETAPSDLAAGDLFLKIIK